jgi:hypothetical protein
VKATSYIYKLKLGVSFPFICSNIPAALAYGVYISQLIRYYRACVSYHGFLHIAANTETTEARVPSGLVESCTVANRTWLTATEYLCHR